MGGGGLWGPGPPGVIKGAPKKEKRKGKKEKGKRKGKKERGEKRGKRGKEGNKKEKKEETGSKKEKKKERKLNQYDERDAMQFQVQAGALGKKTSGAPI